MITYIIHDSNHHICSSFLLSNVGIVIIVVVQEIALYGISLHEEVHYREFDTVILVILICSFKSSNPTPTHLKLIFACQEPSTHSLHVQCGPELRKGDLEEEAKKKLQSIFKSITSSNNPTTRS